MDRFKNFVATGLAPNGRLYAGDLLQMQDLAAALSDFDQAIDLGTLRIGDTGIAIVKYGTAEARLTAALRVDGILRGLGGFVAGTFTTTQRNAIAAGSRPYGMVILNTTESQYEWNAGSDATPNWVPLGTDPSSVLSYALANAKGDLIVGSGNDAFGILAVGSNGKVPRADSTQTLGIKWDDILIYDVAAARPAASAATGKIFVASDTGNGDYSNGSTWLRIFSRQVATSVTTLPPDPVDGQEIVYKGGTNIYWRLIWIAADNKWQFLGGSPMRDFISSDEGGSHFSTSFTNLPTIGPSLTPPENGFYTVKIGARFDTNVANGGCQMSYSIGGGGAGDNNAVMGGSRGDPADYSNKRDLTLTKNQSLVAKYRVTEDDAGDTKFGKRWMEILPIYLTA